MTSDCYCLYGYVLYFKVSDLNKYPNLKYYLPNHPETPL